MVFSHITVFALKVKVGQSCLTLQSHGLLPARLLCPWNSPGKNTGVDRHALLQGIFPTQRSNSIQSPRYRQVLYHLSHQGSPYLPYLDFYGLTIHLSTLPSIHLVFLMHFKVSGISMFHPTNVTSNKLRLAFLPTS